MEFTLRAATVDDVEPLTRMHLAAWRESYGHLLPEEFFAFREATINTRIERQREALAGSYKPILAHDADGALVGIASSGQSRDEDGPCDVELQMIYTLRRVHGLGVGQALLDAVVGNAAAYLWVLEDNPRAQAFYRKNGFQPDGTRQLLPPDWHELPEIRMVRAAVGGRPQG
ncbi:GNAT family N-acetyltransferase [Arthrobacter sp. SRS-W-1-2016]|jgi:ribosomal protein S18 acetylase RimI-like enzyme|uniref:GNAT family N-acetyltransferase n=1 Tax=Arthrobacter sp. SRS-W-1-2016 TaxID=1930254 RepID=UPI000990A4BC|nr:GNAT family N-acetyltransferase [Arthrobacter sp. SRS-W-1-2016]OOP62513.1 GNAT family N-acetyltransferase [Arthrobacter sp. SRS-W-1-2016]